MAVAFRLPLERILVPAGEMDARLRTRLTAGEMAGLLLALAFTAIFTWSIQIGYYKPVDYSIYLRAAGGDTAYFYYAYWIIPFFYPFSLLSLPLGYLLWSLLNTLSVFFAARVFGGRAGLALISFQFLALLNFGQVTGFLIGGLALLWWGLAHKRWYLAGLGLLICCSKYQLGIPVSLALLAFSEQPLKELWRVLVVPALGVGLSFVLYPGWFFEALHYVQSTPPDSMASIATWRLIGFGAVVFWLPPLFLPLPRSNRIASLVAAAALGVPYFQQADLVLLYVFPFGWLPLLGFLGLFQKFFTSIPYLLVVAAPLAMYFGALVQPFWGSWRGKLDTTN
jgi:hypothetical protein